MPRRSSPEGPQKLRWHVRNSWPDILGDWIFRETHLLEPPSHFCADTVELRSGARSSTTGAARAYTLVNTTEQFGRPVSARSCWKRKMRLVASFGLVCLVLMGVCATAPALVRLPCQPHAAAHFQDGPMRWCAAPSSAHHEITRELTRALGSHPLCRVFLVTARCTIGRCAGPQWRQ